MQEQTADVTFVLSDLNNRVRTLENKYNLFGERLLIVNKNMIEEYKNIIREIKLINADLREIKNETHHVKEVINNVVGEMEFFARRDQVKVLDKYIKLWDPIKFVTDEQLQAILDERLKQQVVKKKTKVVASGRKRG
jgi:ribosomal protein S4